MDKFFAYFFAFSCFGTAAISQSIMGAGMWFWLIISAGFFVIISQYYQALKMPGAGIALLASLLSIAAITLGLLAATIGGSFRLETQEALLLFLFFLMAISGFTLSAICKHQLKQG